MSKAPKQFTDTLRDVRGGAVIDDLTEKLRELVLAVNQTGGSGNITLKLSVKRASKGNASALMISDDIKVKMPVVEKGESILFATEEGELTRSDPRQPQLRGMDRPAPVLQGPGSEAVAAGQQ